MRFTLVHFDFDGTLVDSRLDLALSLNHVRRRFGLPDVLASEMHRFVGRGVRALIERALGPERAADHGCALEAFLAHYGEHCLDQTRAYPGMEALLETLGGDGVRFSVVTNKLERLARRILDGLSLGRHLVAVVGGDTFPERKPDPRGVEHVRSITGLARERCLMVGDSAVDVETARAAGIASAGVLWGLDPVGVAAAGPDFLIEGAAALERTIRG